MARSKIMFWHWGQSGAGCKFTLDLSAAFVGLGRIPCCISAARGSELAARAAADPAIAVRLVPSPPRRFAGVRSIIQILRWLTTPNVVGRMLDETRPNVALCTMQSIWDLVALPGLRRRKIRYVLVLHDAWFRVGDSYPLRAWALRRQIAASDGLIVLSDHVKAVAQATFSYPPSRILTVPHGAFHFGDFGPSLPRMRDRNQPLRLLFLGRIVAYKGLGLLLQAYRNARQRGADVSLSVFGDGDITGLSQDLASLPDVRLENRWLGEDEIAAALRECDVVVLPYVEATQSGIAAAAFAAGLPVIATPVGGLIDQVSHGRTGLVASELGSMALADAIVRLSEDDELYDRLSQGALSHARDDLSWSRIAIKMIAFLDMIHGMPARDLEGRPTTRTTGFLPTETQVRS